MTDGEKLDDVTSDETKLVDSDVMKLWLKTEESEKKIGETLNILLIIAYLRFNKNWLVLMK